MYREEVNTFIRAWINHCLVLTYIPKQFQKLKNFWELQEKAVSIASCRHHVCC